MNRLVCALTVMLLFTGMFGSARAADTPDSSTVQPKKVTKSWHSWTVKEIIRDFLVQVEYDAGRSKTQKNEQALEVFEKLEKDIRAFDRDLDDATRQLQWADKRFDKHRDRLDELAKRVNKARLPCVPFSMSHSFTSPELERLEELKRQFKDNPECLIPELERLLEEMQRRGKEQNRQPEKPDE